jgi:hypothetical protein
MLLRQTGESALAKISETEKLNFDIIVKMVVKLLSL